MLRIIPAFIGLGLGVLWVMGLSVDATTWLTWLDGIAAPLCALTVGLIPERRAAPVAALCLGLIAGGLFVSWVVGLRQGATGWLAWWTFVAAGATVLAAVGAAAQGVLDGMRARPLI
jgi:hypothetical protein